MKIWVDADACPAVIKEIILRAAERTRTATTFVANQALRLPASTFVRSVQVGAGFNVADQHIIDAVECDDLVVTADIPLAAAVIKKGARALNPRGELYTADTIGERLSMRNLLDELRGGGLVTGGPSALSTRDREAFANALDRVLRKAIQQLR